MARACGEVTPEGVAAVGFLLDEPQSTFLMLAIALEICAIRVAEQGEAQQYSRWHFLSEEAIRLCDVVEIMRGRYGQVPLRELRETAQRHWGEVPW